jgi:hypothetical protein
MPLPARAVSSSFEEQDLLDGLLVECTPSLEVVKHGIYMFSVIGGIPDRKFMD